YRQPLRIWDFLFGLLRRSRLDNEKAVVTGWYRRSPMPYIEMKTLEAGGTTRKCYTYHFKIGLSVVAVLAGMILMLTI
ncbi:MAG: hypothetical protein ACYTG7_03420, partial [Planctomycetota bacterium]